MRPIQHALVLFVATCLLPANATAQTAAPDPGLVEDLVAANRILFDQGVVDGFGHISVRHDKDPNRYLMARNVAPALVKAEDIMEFDLDSNAADLRGRRIYLERFIHGEIYKLRPDVKAVIHSHSPSVIPFGVARARLQPIYHMSAFLGTDVPVFEIRDVAGTGTDLLVRNAALGRALAQVLGNHTVALMRGHGSVTVGGSIPQVVFRAVYTEMNAKLQAEAMRLGTVTFLTPEEAEKAAETIDGQVMRPWELWKRKAMQAQ